MNATQLWGKCMRLSAELQMLRDARSQNTPQSRRVATDLAVEHAKLRMLNAKDGSASGSSREVIPAG